LRVVVVARAIRSASIAFERAHTLSVTFLSASLETGSDSEQHERRARSGASSSDVIGRAARARRDDPVEKPSNRYTTAERLICRLRDVSSCDIQAAPNGEIAAIHVTARAGRSPKQIARDIEAILAAEESITVDHRKISIAQFGEAELPREAQETLARIALGGVSLHHAPGGVEVEVTLAAGAIQATGRAAGTNTRFEVRRVVAQATVDAVTKLVDGEPVFSLGELEEKDLGAKRVVLVCVNRSHGRSESNLIGCCEVGYDPTQAVIFAVLDALNRLVSTLRPRQAVEYEIGPTPSG
jgi:hypothetical protein